jgi:hypothetical protein
MALDTFRLIKLNNLNHSAIRNRWDALDQQLSYKQHAAEIKK